MNKPDEFLKKMVDEGKVINDESKFHIHNRIDSWQKQAPNYQDRDLDKLQTAMLNVFMEEDPQYELAKDNRMFANVQGRNLKYSSELRRGLAISLALVGNYNDLLINCSEDKRKNFVAEVLHNVFANISWKRIATLDSVLPFFAEAAPAVFLSEVENLADNKKVIKDLIADEGDIFQGGFHWSGLLDALEILAWEPEYFTKVVDVLAKLAIVDCGESNIHPRPKDTLISIFIPWFVQTTVDTDTLIASARALSEKFPELGWDVLSATLGTTTASLNTRPQIRKNLAPDSDKTLSRTYAIISKIDAAYRNTMLEMATKSIDFTEKMLQHFSKFKESPFFEKALDILSSSMILNSDDEIKEKIWSAVDKICIEHRRYKAANWTMSEDKITQLLNILPLIQPESIFWQKKHVFDRCCWDWFETDDYRTEESKAINCQTETAREIFDIHGLAGIFILANLVEIPEYLGSAVKRANILLDNAIIKDLPIESNKNFHDFLRGYLGQCFADGKESWLNTFADEVWSDNKKAMFLSCLRFTSTVWHFAEKWLEDESKYWHAVNVRIVGDEPDCEFAIEKALKYNRPDLAVECIAWALHRKQETDFNLCVESLKKLTNSDFVTKVDRWHIIQIITNLQKRVKSNEEKRGLIIIEFLYLALLDASADPDVKPTVLNNVLATEPEFFQEIIAMLYKSTKAIESQNRNEFFAHNAFKLLHQWNVVPGLNSDGNFEYSIFQKWYKKALELCKQSGHLEIAQLHVGNILFYTPADENGLWINKDIASLINEENNDVLRRGYFHEAINSRGISAVDFSGEKDLERANGYSQKAEELEKHGFLNFAQTLQELAKDSEEDAKRNIKEGKELHKEREL